MAGLFKDHSSERSKSKRQWTPLPSRGHPQTVGEFYTNPAASTSQAPSREIPNKGQFETSREGDEQTFATDQIEPLQDPPIDHEMTEQPQAQQDPALVAVINAAVQAAMTFQQQNQQPTTSKNYKISDQTPFDGKAENIEPFLQECETRFKVLPNDYDTIDKRVFYALFLMKNGLAKAWKDQYLNSQQGMPWLAEANQWANFTKSLKESFTDPG